MHVLNLGIVAHVDAGKTSLTERLLFRAGVIDRIGSVDEGSTQTDSLALERQRGITIKSAVATFPVGDVTVNLVDTPGHPDFIAEVERALRVLDGVVLVVSAVEGVQAQTRILMRALLRLRVPTLLFVNKIDRRGARHDDLLAEIARRLTPAIAPMGRPAGLGTPQARFEPGDDELLAGHDDRLLGAYFDGRARAELAALVAAAGVVPVYFGSAVTGAGVDDLVDGLVTLLPRAGGDPAGPAEGVVFKVDRGPAGEKVAYVRMFGGAIRVRERIGEDKVTAIGVPHQVSELTAGQIGKVWGLREVRIGDAVGIGRPMPPLFAPPTLETVVVPRDPRDRGRLHVALKRLAEQDPLINLRHDNTLSLFGEVQKEVIQQTLAAEHDVEADFEGSTVIHVERVTGTGHAVRHLREDGNPHMATIGLRIEPAPPGSGAGFRMAVPFETLPMYVYKHADEFRAAMAEYVRTTLREGPHGRAVIDCLVTLTECGYESPGSTAGDYRRLTPLVLGEALRRAGTHVCEPVQRFRLEGPADMIGATLGALGRFGAVPETQEVPGAEFTVTGLIPAANVAALERRLPSLTRGEGVLEVGFAGYRAV